FQGLQPYLESNQIKYFKESNPRQLKGFIESPTIFYRLTMRSGTEDIPIDLKSCLERLREKTQEIDVLAGLYPAIDMEKNFINLRVESENIPEGRGVSSRMILEYHKRLEPSMDREEIEKPKKIFTAKEIFEGFNKGYIYGLPGAGKTTILRYFIYSTFKIRRSLPVYSECKFLPEFEPWCQSRGFDQNSARYDTEAGLKYFLYAFLFPGKSPDSLSVDELVALQGAENEIISKWENSSVAIFVDALDEAPIQQRRIILDLIKTIMTDIKGKNTNKIFLTSRPIDRGEHDTDNEPVFNVESLDMEQVRQLAGIFYGEETELYKEFDTIVWQEEVVKKIAGTPLVAILLIKYYEVFHRLDSRYQMYDLLLKFFLLKIWEEIKAKRFNKKLDYFFMDAREDLRDPDAANQYNCLSKLSYDCLYKSTREGKAPLRSIPLSTVRAHFSLWLKNNNPLTPFSKGESSDQRIADEVKQWIDGLQQEQLLISSGYEEFVILHSTIMEFLAGRWLVKELERVNIKEIANQDVAYEFETLPIAASRDMNTGYEILERIKDGFAPDERKNPVLSLAYSVLCEVEEREEKELKVRETLPVREECLQEIKKNRHKVEWLYQCLSAILYGEDKKVLEEALGYYQGLSKLSRNTLLEYMDTDRFLDIAADIETARMHLIERMMRKESIDDWTGHWYQKKWGVPDRFLLKLDTDKYHPDDKNFGYYHRLIPELRGFFGSPNLRHDDSVLSCAFSPDGLHLLSASEDNTLRLWEKETGREIRQFKGHTARILSCAFSTDGRQILSGSHDNTLKLWDTESGKELQSIALLWTPNAISINPANRNEFITANANCTLTLFAVIPNNCEESGNPLLKGVDA
ncbi:hypothetical protein HY792_07675, partial [Candidatus Desantisbacteria bacterium]|nr:hypothetical protein [Candidatus Desantisbacteria bacterium]